MQFSFSLAKLQKNLRICKKKCNFAAIFEKYTLYMIKVALFGYGNIGHYAEQAIRLAPDMELVGIFHHDEVEQAIAAKPEVVLLSIPSREVPKVAPQFLQAGISTVDSFDIHSDIPTVREQLNGTASRAVSILSAGWDPGTDSVVRCMLEAMAPGGTTYTNFGPGRSMGHTVVAKSKAGVKDALSMTLPVGNGVHKREVYVVLEEGALLKDVEQAIKQDPYFVNDDTKVIAVPSLDGISTVQHGVLIERNGVSGETENQQMAFEMTINNPALTGQVMTSCARAAYRLAQSKQFGCYTLIELPLVTLLPGTAEENVKRLV